MRRLVKMDVPFSPTYSLLSLTTEILVRVFDHLGSDSPESSRACLLVCKQLYEVALPSSVHTYCPRWVPTFEEYRYGKYNPGSTRRPLLEFVEYVTIVKPSLAKRVKCVRIGGYTTRGPTKEADRLLHKQHRDQYYGMVTEALSWDGAKDSEKQLYTRFCDNFREDLRLGSEEAELCLLLAVCPCIEDFCFGYLDGTSLLGEFVQLAAMRLRYCSDDHTILHHRPPLHNLRSVYHESDPQNNDYEYPSHVVTPFFCLPSVTSYECVLANAGEETEPLPADPAMPNRSSPIRDLWIRGSCMTNTRLNAMTIACESLRSFEYLLGTDVRWQEVEVMPREILHALLPHKGTLEYLHINQEDDVVKRRWENNPEGHVLGSELADMSVLTTLITGMQSLTGGLDAVPPEDRRYLLPQLKVECPELVECLPSSLKRLEIHHCTSSILHQAQTLLDSLADPKPRLAKLTHIRLLFLAELTKPEDVKLRCHETTAIKLEILYQTKDHRVFDLLPIWDSGNYVFMFTRLYDQTNQLRKEWLQKRGTNEGLMARDTNGVYVPTILPSASRAEVDHKGSIC